MTRDEGKLIIKQNPNLMRQMRKNVALVRAQAVLQQIADSQGMVIPLQEVKKVLKLPGFQEVNNL